MSLWKKTRASLCHPSRDGRLRRAVVCSHRLPFGSAADLWVPCHCVFELRAGSPSVARQFPFLPPTQSLSYVLKYFFLHPPMTRINFVTLLTLS